MPGSVPVGTPLFDLEYDPNEVGGDEESVRQGKVVRRAGNRVWVQLNLPSAASPVA